MQEQAETITEYLTLTQTAKIAPGRPTANAIWRWCRRGVKSRSGARVHLRHIRVGGQIFTTRGWLEAFGRQLAEADARYFTLVDAAADTKSRDSRSACSRPSQLSRRASARQRHLERIERELEGEGL